MRFNPGNVVRSIAGRDKGRLYVVTGVGTGRVLVAEGRKRVIKAAKPKNPIHLQFVSEGKPVASDEEIREILLDFADKAEEEEGNRIGETRCR